VAMINEREACESSCVSSGHCRAGGSTSVYRKLLVGTWMPLSRLMPPRPSACLLHWHPARRIRSIRLRDAVTTTMWYRERLLSVADAAALIRQVLELHRYHMNDVTFALHATMTMEHPGREDNPALPVEQA
jgi:hypothetical protein